MKKSLFLFIVLSYNFLIAESYLQTNFQTYNYFSTFENQFSWRYKPDPDFYLLFDTNYANSSNSSFNRSSENINYNYTLLYDKYKVKPFLIYNFSSYYNSGLPEDSVSINDKKMDKSGFGYQVLLLDNKLFLQQSGNYLKLSNPHNDFFGWNSDSRITFQNQDKYNRFSSAYYYNKQDINLDRNSSQGLDINYFFQNINSFQTNLKYDYLRRDIYFYNYLEDKSIRDEYLGNIAFDYWITDNFEWIVQNRANFRDLNYLENTKRDSWAFENELNNQINYKMDRSIYFTKLRLANNKRFTKSIDSSRPDQKFETIEKKFGYGAYYKLFYADTLRVEISNSIMQNYNSQSSNSMDNDMTMTIYEIFSSHNYNDHYFNNLFQFYQGQQIYIHHSLSAYNHDKLSYIWQPETNLRLYDNFRIINKYRISADYEYYTWTDFITDRFYRMFFGEWGLLYSNKNEYYFSSFKKHNLELYFAFILENIMTAEKQENYWLQSSSQYQRHYLMVLDYERKAYKLRFQPVVNYFNNTFEAEVQTNFSLFLHRFQINSSINPVGKQFNKMIWKFNLEVNYNF